MMKVLATVLGIVVVLAGIVGIIAPGALLSVGRSAITPAGIYFIAALRLSVGVLFICVAGTSRLPRTVRILGIAVVLSGIATPIFGVDRSLAVLDWWGSQNAFILRAPAIILVGVGTFIVYVIGARREPV